MAERLKKAVAKNLRLAFLVAIQSRGVIDEFGYGFNDLRHIYLLQ